MDILFLIFGEISILFSVVTALIYIPTNSVWMFSILHILAKTCYLLPFLTIVILIGVTYLTVLTWISLITSTVEHLSCVC